MESEIEDYVNSLTATYTGITSVWLFGSRANGTEREDSDWDLLAFADKDVFNSLKADTRFYNERIDLLVVVDKEGNLEKPWGRTKKGNLFRWQWQQESQETATYLSVKFIPESVNSNHGKFDEQRLKAILIKRREAI